MAHTSPRFLSEKQKVVYEAILYAEYAHEKSSPRLRGNHARDGEDTHPDGPTRNYICHPLELAFVAASYEVFAREEHPRRQPGFHVRAAERIEADVKRAATMSRDELVQALLDTADRLNDRQLGKIVGYICHDVFEESYCLDTPVLEKVRIINLHKANIARIHKGGARVAWAMTDNPNISTQQQKQKSQQRRARTRQRNYFLNAAREGKVLDCMLNTYDQALILDAQRPRERKLRTVDRMSGSTEAAIKAGGIPQAYAIAFRTIYVDTMLQLAPQGPA